MEKEIEIFEEYVHRKGLKYSGKRNIVLKAFLKSDRHVSAEELFSLVKQDHPDIGYTTVYRALKLIEGSGIADAVHFNDGVRRFERTIGHEHQAHFICTHCGGHFEVVDENIYNLSASLAKEQGFLPQKQRIEIYGMCKDCS